MSRHIQADPRIAGMSFEERATLALWLVISLMSQIAAAARNRRKHCDERAKLMSDTEERFCFEIITAIKQAGIDYDDAVAKMKAWQEGVGKTIHEVERGTFAAPRARRASSSTGKGKADNSKRTTARRGE